MKPPPKLGQHFLQRSSVLSAIVSAARLRSGDRVVEVGAGDGRLTEHLVEAVLPGGGVVALELDDKLAPATAARLARYGGAAAVLHQSAADTSTPLPSPCDVLVGNIPYHISSDLLHRLVVRGRGGAMCAGVDVGGEEGGGKRETTG